MLKICVFEKECWKGPDLKLRSEVVCRHVHGYNLKSTVDQRADLREQEGGRGLRC